MQEHVLYQKKITFQKGDNKFVWGPVRLNSLKTSFAANSVVM